MLRTLAPVADRLERRFTSLLRRHGHEEAQIGALLAISPAAAAAAGLGGAVLEAGGGQRPAAGQAERTARQKSRALFAGFDRLLDPVLGGRFGPAREQLQLAARSPCTRPSTRCGKGKRRPFYGLYRAEIDAADLDDLLRRFVAILARTLHARAGRLALLPDTADPRLHSPLYIGRGNPDEALIVDRADARAA